MVFQDYALYPHMSVAKNIALAAQTLGDRTNNADLMKALVEAKFVDGLRSVAATMTIDLR